MPKVQEWLGKVAREVKDNLLAIKETVDHYRRCFAACRRGSVTGLDISDESSLNCGRCW